MHDATVHPSWDVDKKCAGSKGVSASPCSLQLHPSHKVSVEASIYYMQQLTVDLRRSGDSVELEVVKRKVTIKTHPSLITMSCPPQLSPSSPVPLPITKILFRIAQESWCQQVQNRENDSNDDPPARIAIPVHAVTRPEASRTEDLGIEGVDAHRILE